MRQNRIILIFVSIGLCSNCVNHKKLPDTNHEPLRTNKDSLLEHPQFKDCLSLKYPEFVDDTAEWDRKPKNYKGVILKAFVKNVCTDSIEITITKLGLDVRPIIWYFNNDFLDENPEYFFKNKLILAPFDSTYLSLAKRNYDIIARLDSIRFLVQFSSNNENFYQYVKVYKKDFIY